MLTNPLVTYPRCYATLLFKDDNATNLRRHFVEDEFMAQLWARRMLATTHLPIYFIYVHTPSIESSLARLRKEDRTNKLHYWPVEFVRGGGWAPCGGGHEARRAATARPTVMEWQWNVL